jgi:integrase
MKPSGYRSYDSAWRNHVQPRWSDTRISDIRYSDVQAWVANLSAGLSASMVANVYSVLARILDDAVRDRLIASNPARGVKLPKRPPAKNVYLTASQLDALAEEAGDYRSLVLMLGTGGMRWGEAAALRVSDVDFLRRRVHLHRNAVKVGSEIIVGTLKSNKNRIVALPGFVVDALAATSAGKGRDDLLWPSRSGGHLGPPSSTGSWLSGAVSRCQQAADAKRTEELRRHPGDRPATPVFQRITAHDLRHTAASLAISAGANPKVVQRMLGHASAAMTLDVYADLFESDIDAVAENVAKMWPRAIGSN